MNNEKNITKNYNSDEFFERIKNQVKQHTEQTLHDFLESVGVKYESFNTLRKTKNFPRCNDAQSIADGLGVSLDYLVTGETKDSGVFKYGEDVKNILENLFSLESEQRDFLLFSLKNQIKYIQESTKK
ncbi:MAG: hypothetical protein MJZ37_01110 [Bacilli bacterium]|nr:hypothetical protein [Bacilli bacterium]